MTKKQDDDYDVMDLLDALADREPASAAWARRQYARGNLSVDIDREAGTATLNMADLPTIVLKIPWWIP